MIHIGTQYNMDRLVSANMQRCVQEGLICQDGTGIQIHWLTKRTCSGYHIADLKIYQFLSTKLIQLLDYKLKIHAYIHVTLPHNPHLSC